MVECHDRVLPYMAPPVEKVSHPFPGCGPRRAAQRPRRQTPGEGLGSLGYPPAGLDSTKEQRHGGRARTLRRGLAVLSLDGPGQGEISTKLPIRHDYEVAVSAAIDYLEWRDDIDAARVGLIGASLGGYYACRAAAFEPRVTAAVANCGPYDWIDCWDELPGGDPGAFRKYSWSSSDEEAREKAKALDLTGVAEKITQPLVVVHGMLDPLIGVDQARRIAEEAPNAP